MAWQLHAIEQKQLRRQNIASMSWGARYLTSTQSRLVARECEDFEAGRAQLRVQPHHLGVVRVRLASFARDVRDQDDLVA